MRAGEECGGQLAGDAQGRDALEEKGPRRGLQNRLGRRLEEVVKAVGAVTVGYKCPLKRALGVRGIAAGHTLGVLGGVRGLPRPFPMHPWLRDQ